MNLRKSIMLALAHHDMRQKDLAQKMEMSQAGITQLMSQTSCTAVMLERLAEAFDMKVSEFVALGED